MVVDVFKVNNLDNVPNFIRNCTLINYGDELQVETSWVTSSIMAGDYLILTKNGEFIANFAEGALPDSLVGETITKI